MCWICALRREERRRRDSSGGRHGTGGRGGSARPARCELCGGNSNGSDSTRSVSSNWMQQSRFLSEVVSTGFSWMRHARAPARSRDTLKFAGDCRPEQLAEFHPLQTPNSSGWRSHILYPAGSSSIPRARSSGKKMMKSWRKILADTSVLSIFAGCRQTRRLKTWSQISPRD